MAAVSSPFSAVLLPVCNSKPRISAPCLISSKLMTVKASGISSSRVMAAPEALEANAGPTVAEGETPSSVSISADTDKVAAKQKIRIKLRSYWVPLIEDSCKQIMDAARTTNAKTMGPVPLPTKKRVYCVLKSPHVNKDARFHFEIRTHQRLIDILYPTAQTIDSLMQLDLPAGVDVEVKL
ncbi:30S ribosomal protein S10, chloroplastic [Andrographis paniculata]|uniref:30S ribosomal protein S10, chloroplastic n=1 Tax=Andrographis paniculata TaxID=175694 RepID=UPI0021E8D37C|nr:30S ribosomal protein S10, chloroplastic [Andrographis paniculata]XP_051136354.1 30S ribosomal protein S10, chloroplastic [Andrographis paniculata]